MNAGNDVSHGAKRAEQDESGRASRDHTTGAPETQPVATTPRGTAQEIAGDLAGNAVAGPVGEAVDPIEQDSYWRARYVAEPYYEKGLVYSDYAPAFRAGYEARARHAGRSFDEVEAELQAGYELNHGASTLTWPQARLASRAAWNRAAAGTLV